MPLKKGLQVRGDAILIIRPVNCLRNNSLSLNGLYVTAVVLPRPASNPSRHVQVAAVKAPGFGDNRKATVHDIAVSTGAIVFNDEASMVKIEDVQLHDLGQVWGPTWARKEDVLTHSLLEALYLL
jgi:hypothetical protein